MEKNNSVLNDLIIRYPQLRDCRKDIESAYTLLEKCYTAKGKVLICGNGGSACDSDHFASNLVKGFTLPRKVEPELLEGKKLQYGLSAISLSSQTAAITATANDNGFEMIFAQQVMAYGIKGDVLVGFSTSGNSGNVVTAAELAKKLGMHTIALTGTSGGKLKEMCDACIRVPEKEGYKVQELHEPVYHCLAIMLEQHFFG